MPSKEGARGHLVNGVVIGFNDACLDIDHAATWQHADDWVSKGAAAGWIAFIALQRNAFFIAMLQTR
jgi:hypothetical protein